MWMLQHLSPHQVVVLVRELEAERSRGGSLAAALKSAKAAAVRRIFHRAPPCPAIPHRVTGVFGAKAEHIATG